MPIILPNITSKRKDRYILRVKIDYNFCKISLFIKRGRWEVFYLEVHSA